MSYQNHFLNPDSLIGHLDTIVPSISDPLIGQRYSGFVCVAAVTSLELCIKQIFEDFAQHKNKVFGSFVKSHFSKINGRIKLPDLRGIHLPLFGEKYKIKFDKILDNKNDEIMRSESRDIKSAYNNIIIWRHSFVHGSNVNCTYLEASQAYRDAKLVVDCLYKAMKR